MACPATAPAWRGKIYPVIATAVALWASPSYAEKPRNDKLTVCTITINSKEERETFKKRLGTKDFEFVELVPEPPNDPKERSQDSDFRQANWFIKACGSGIQCDVLVISGHFAGKFFGSSGHSLSLDQLEDQSCNKSCTGILEKPIETFLFGCNTLAGKEKDTRTPEEYFEVLLEDGISGDLAQQIVEFRYGPLGPANQDRMSRVFSKTPHVYGFSSVGPLGKNVKGFLETYFRNKPSYADYLVNEAFTYVANQAKAGPVGKNEQLRSALALTTFTECAGIDFTNPGDEIKANLCKLRDRSIPLHGRLQLARTLLQSSQFLTYIPTLNSILEENADRNSMLGRPENYFTRKANAAMEAIRASDSLRHSIEQIQATSVLPQTKLELAKLSYRIGWMSREDYIAAYDGTMRALLQPPVTVAHADLFCSLIGDPIASTPKNIYGFEIRAEDVKPEILKTADGRRALACMETKDQRIIDLVGTALGSRDPAAREDATELLRLWGADLDPFASTLIRLALKDPSKKARKAAVRALLVGALSPKARARAGEALARLLEPNKPNMDLLRDIAYFYKGPATPGLIRAALALLRHRDASVRSIAVFLLANLGEKRPEVKTTALELVQTLSFGSQNDRANFERVENALSQLPLTASDYEKLIHTRKNRWLAIEAMTSNPPGDPDTYIRAMSWIDEADDKRWFKLDGLKGHQQTSPKVHKALFSMAQKGRPGGWKQCEIYSVLGSWKVSDPEILERVTTEIIQGNLSMCPLKVAAIVGQNTESTAFQNLKTAALGGKIESSLAQIMALLVFAAYDRKTVSVYAEKLDFKLEPSLSFELFFTYLHLTNDEAAQVLPAFEHLTIDRHQMTEALRLRLKYREHFDDRTMELIETFELRDSEILHELAKELRQRGSARIARYFTRIKPADPTVRQAIEQSGYDLELD